MRLSSDLYTKIVLTLIAVGLFLNVVSNGIASAQLYGPVECENCATRADLYSALSSASVYCTNIDDSNCATTSDLLIYCSD